MTTVIESPAEALRPAPAEAPSAIAQSTQLAWDPVSFRVERAPARRACEESDERESWTETPPLPNPRQWAAAMAKASVECLLGFRPAAQLTRWLDTPIFEAIYRRAALAARVRVGDGACSTRLVSAHVQEKADHSVEATVAIHDGQRVRAVALLLEVFHGRWLVTSLEIG